MWSVDYAVCVICGRTEFKHVSRGLCNSCYQKWYKSDPKRNAKVIQQKRDWYFKYHEYNLVKGKLRRERIHYDSKRDDILKRDGYKCTKCGSSKKLVVHHKDKNGRGSPEPNNNKKNLVTLCRSCHIEAHRDLLEATKRTRKNGFWSKTLTACRSCGRSDRKHAGYGLCQYCYHQQIERPKLGR